MTTLEPASVALKLAFLAVLYLFLLWVVRSAWKDLRNTRDAGLGASVAPGGVVHASAPAATDVDATGLHRAGEPVLGHGGAADGEPRLVVERAAGHPDGIAYSLEHGATLGRGDVEIRLEDPFASTRHARIERQGSVLVVEDLGSTNGTLLNEEPLTGPQPLHHGDRIRIGDSELTYLQD
jgi:FHA domain